MTDKVRNPKRAQVVKRLKAKYGEDIFRRWGSRGGSPILKAWAAKKKQKSR